MYLWIKLFGDSLFAVRFFSVVMGILSISLAYWLTRHLFNEYAAIFSSLFISISAFGVRYSQEARAYSLIIVLGLSAWLFLLRFEKQSKILDAFCFAAFTCAGLYTHYFYIFVALAQFVYFTFAYRNNSGKLDRFYLAFLAALLFLSAWVMLVVTRGYRFDLIEWIFLYPGLMNKIYNLFFGFSRYLFIFDSPDKRAQYLFSGIGASLLIYLAFRAFKDIVQKYPKQFWFCLSMILLPLLGMLTIDLLECGAILRQERFWIFPFLGFVPIIGYFLNRSFTKNRLITGLIILCVFLSSVKVSAVQFGPASGQTSRWINKESGLKISAVIVYDIRTVVIPQAYYLQDNVYLIPVSNYEQLKSAVKTIPRYVDKIFISRHYHRTDPSLMDQPFMETKDLGPKFRFKDSIYMDNISVLEYIRCAS
jgi:uncharacterized membrane protein